MKKDTEKTKVIFYNEVVEDAVGRKYTTVLAVFPELPSDVDGKFITCYMHVGQHSGMDPDYVKNFELANESEYNSLFKELEGMGYNLETVEDRIKELSNGDLSDADIDIIVVHMEGVEPFMIIDNDYIQGHVDDFYEFRYEYTEENQSFPVEGWDDTEKDKFIASLPPNEDGDLLTNKEIANAFFPDNA